MRGAPEVRRQVEHAGNTRSLRAKTARVARILETFLGTPRRPRVSPDPLEMLIATILSQNTNDKNSFRAYRLLKAKYRSWGAMEKAPKRSLVAAIRVGGMADQKAARIKETLGVVRQRYGRFDLSALRRMSNGEVMEELTRMNGVGPKTAACVLLFSMRREVFPVDTHIHRLCNRLGLVSGAGTPEKTFEHMQPLVPPGRAYSLHTNLIRFGRGICRSNRPACDRCPLYGECVYEKKGMRHPQQRALADTRHDFMLLDNIGTPQ